MLTLSLSSSQSTEALTNLINKLLHLLIKSSTKYHQPSFKTLKMIFSRLSMVSQNKVTMRCFSDYVTTHVNSKFFATLKYGDILQIINCQPIDGVICERMLKGNKHHASSFAQQLKTIDTDLPSQAPLISSLLIVNPSLINVQAYLGKVKDEILQWALSEESEMNCSYQILLEHMLQSHIIDKAELSNICKSWYEKAVNLKNEIPLHIVSISPAFKYLSKEDNNNNTEGSVSPNLQLLCLCIIGIAKTYGKSHDQNTLEMGNLLISLLSENDISSIQEELLNKKLWSSYVKQVLKHSFTDKQNGALHLECLIKLAKIVYMNENSKECALPSTTFYQMLRSHSEFIPLMLGQDDTLEKIKEKIVNLQMAIAEINNKVCEERHIPVLLGAYGATRSSCDQIILKLLCLYECSGHMTTYNLTLWGNMAVTHYAAEEIPGVSSTYGAPRHHQTLLLLETDKVIQTALKFDMALGLEPCSVSEPDSSIYDQRFLLLLFLNLTTDEPQVDILQMVEKGIVALAIAALSSHCEEVWCTGATILQNIVMHFQNSNHKNLKYQWLWLIAVVGYGMENAKVRIPSLLTHFLIRVTQLLLKPEDAMYRSVLNYVYLKPALALFKVPELLVFFFSDNPMRHREQKTFVLQLLISGIRDTLDINVCEAGFVPKFVLGSLTSLTMNTHMRVLSLKVLKTMVSIPEGAFNLVAKKSLLIQLPLALEANLSCPIEDISHWIAPVIEVLETLWETWIKTYSLFSKQPDESKIQPKKQNTKKRKNPQSSSDISHHVSPNSKKKRKSNEGSVINEPPKSKEKQLEKAKSKLMSTVSEFLVCLGQVVPKVVAYGNPSSVASCFSLLCKVVTATDKLNFVLQPSSLKITVFDPSLIRQQVLSWIDETKLLRRFPERFADKELTCTYSYKPSRQEWKQLPLRVTKTEENCSYENITKNEINSNVQLLLESTRTLFSMLHLHNKAL